MDTCATRLRALPLFGPPHLKRSSWKPCSECEYLGRCSVCPLSIGLAVGNTDPLRVPDFQCAFARTAFACRDRFPSQSPLQDTFTRLERLIGSARASGDEAREADAASSSTSREWPTTSGTHLGT